MLYDNIIKTQVHLMDRYCVLGHMIYFQAELCSIRYFILKVQEDEHLNRHWMVSLCVLQTLHPKTF